jgi:hypothetical protein
MPRGTRRLATLTAVLGLMQAVPSFAQAPDSVAATPPAAGAAPAAEPEAPPQRPQLRAKPIPAKAEAGIKLDGRLDEPEWADAEAIANLVQFEPEEGVAPAGRTTVRVLASPTGIVIGFRCEQDTSNIVSFSKARDVELDEEDHVLIVLDTFGDERSGFVFAVNPTGSRFDGLINSTGDDVNSNWDALWEAGVTRDASGWSGEIRLPLQSLSYKSGLDHWGFNLERRVQSLQESSRWSGAKRDYEIFQMTHAGVLAGLPKFDVGLGLTIRPGVVGRYFMPDVEEPREFESDVSLDVTQKLGPNLSGTVTVNTDFAEIEVDERQTNLTRFDVLFPEKRSFFLEGADIFEFGLGLDLEEANVLPFFSRRIGLFTPEGEDEGTTVPINVGGKIQGRVGETNIGALVVSSGAVDEFGVPSTEVGVLRVRQNVLAESSVGVLATSGDPIGRRAWTAGADFTYRTSRFLQDKNLQAGAWVLANDRDDLAEDKTSYGGKLAYPNDLWDFEATYFRIGEDFDPSLGFIQRDGHIFYGAAKVSPRPEKSAVRLFDTAVSYFQNSKADGGWVSYRALLTPADVLFESGDRLGISVEPQGERPDEPFDLFDSPEKTVELLDGEYKWTRYSVTGTLAAQRTFSGALTYAFGGFYDGDLQTVEADLQFKPSPLLTLRFTGERNHATLPAGDFTQYLWGMRSELKLTPELQATNFVQYDNESRSLGSSSRLRWTFHPQGDLFVTFNQNMVRTFEKPLEDRWIFLTDQLLVKLQYAFRL